MSTTNVALYPHRVAAPAAHGVSESFYDGLNRAVALLLLIALAPLLFCICWRIWRNDGLPILFAHYRVGKDGTLFRCLKFRTMVLDADRVLGRLLLDSAEVRSEWERNHKLRDDPRITPIGRFLRRTSLDELPQLINVVCGDMNLVGPRPIVVQELRKYGAAKFHYLSIKPGMTGLWQVSGRNRTSYEERVRLDRVYVENQSLWLDCRILIKTARVLLAHDGC
jgi:lipopolysaccharide/colanic/teichoic acid biosynthesis glycosyltransferase